jgi:hypothetical protein
MPIRLVVRDNIASAGGIQSKTPDNLGIRGHEALSLDDHLASPAGDRRAKRVKEGVTGNSST